MELKDTDTRNVSTVIFQFSGYDYLVNVINWGTTEIKTHRSITEPVFSFFSFASFPSIFGAEGRGEKLLTR